MPLATGKQSPDYFGVFFNFISDLFQTVTAYNLMGKNILLLPCEVQFDESFFSPLLAQKRNLVSFECLAWLIFHFKWKTLFRKRKCLADADRNYLKYRINIQTSYLNFLHRLTDVYNMVLDFRYIVLQCIIMIKVDIFNKSIMIAKWRN